MGVQAGIVVRGWLKPTLEVTLVEGGSLLPDTKYYVTGFMGYTLRTYISYGGPMSDVYEITTTSTHKSIQITQKTYRNITVFADNGDGKTRITCPRHCLDESYGDQIKIDSGDYAGTWSIEWVDYDTVLIDTTYVSNTPVQCYTDSVTYNGARGMMYWIYTENPWTGDVFNLYSRWTRRPWQTTLIENPATITSQPTQNSIGYTVHPQLNGPRNGIYKVLDDYGTIAVICTDAVTPQIILDEVQYSGFIYNCSYSLTGYSNTYHFNLAGCLYGSGESTELTMTGVSIAMWGEIYQTTDGALFTFNNCNIQFVLNHFSAAYKFTANDSIIYNNSTSNTYTQWVYGDDTVFYAIPRISWTTCDIVGLQYTELSDMSLKNYGVCQNKEFRNIGVNQIFQTSYNGNQIKNCTIRMPFYWILKYYTNPDIYMCENVTVYKLGSYDFHYRFYTYTPAEYNHIKFLNVNTPDSNNIKKIVHNSAMDSIFDFYRRVEFYIQDNGTLLEDSSINIEDGVGNQYQGTTDASGYTYIDVLEQRTEYEQADGTLSNWVDDYDTYYTDFDITVSKDGYYTDTMNFNSLYGNETIKVALKTIEPPVYIDRDISGSIEDNSISGSISTPEISGSIEDNNISGSIVVEEVSGSIEMDL